MLIAPIALVALTATACSVQLGNADPAAKTTSLGAVAPLKGDVGGVAPVVQRVLPSVVNVTSDIFQSDGLGGGQQGRGVGTGFVVRSDGVIVTNCHVVEGASKLTVYSSDEDPERWDARVIGGDCLNDIAILKIDATDLPALQIGDSEGLQLGQRVVALGYALGLDGGPSVTSGIVSSLDRTIEAPDPNCSVCSIGPDGTPIRKYPSVIQTDAAINPGNSGGPLVDMAGRVVGVNSAGANTAENIGFAIPIASIRDTIAQAIEDPLAPLAYLGVSTQEVTGQVAAQFSLPVDSGAYVVATMNGGPAAEAGIAEGDVIVAVNGSEVSTPEDLGSVLEGLTPGDAATVEVVRDGGERISIEVTLGQKPLPNELP
jgi:S1-C subfamily serine protease